MAVERLDGVREAMFSFERSEGFVTYDATATNVERIIDGLGEGTGYVATQRHEGELDR